MSSNDYFQFWSFFTLPKDKRLPCWQFLSLRDIFHQLLSQRRIDLSSDLHCLRGALVILALPAVLDETQNFFQGLNSWQITACGSDRRCDTWQAIQTCLFFFLQIFLFRFMFPFLHAIVPELKLWGHACLWTSLKGPVKGDHRKETFWNV